MRGRRVVVQGIRIAVRRVAGLLIDCVHRRLLLRFVWPALQFVVLRSRRRLVNALGRLKQRRTIQRILICVAGRDVENDSVAQRLDRPEVVGQLVAFPVSDRSKDANLQ